MKMFRLYLFCLILFSAPVFAITFDFILPGSTEQAAELRPHLEGFFTLLQSATGLEISGDAVERADDIKALFEKNGVDVALLPADALASAPPTWGLSPLISTIPLHASGPYEKFYILGALDSSLDFTSPGKSPVSLVTALPFDRDDLAKIVFAGDPVLTQITWVIEKNENWLSALQKIAGGQSPAVALVSGSQYAEAKYLIRNAVDYKNLRLVYTSPERPSAVVVTPSASRLSLEQKQTLKNALLNIGSSVTGKVILKNLGLKGFSDP